MKLEIKERKSNPLMKREEALVSIEHGGKATPNRRQVIAEVAKLLDARPEGIIIDRITTQGGMASSEVRVLAYSRKEDIPAWRLRKMEQRLSKTKEGAGEKPAETKEEAKEEAGAGEPPGEEAKEVPERAGSEEKPGEGSEQEEATQGEKGPEEKAG